MACKPHPVSSIETHLCWDRGRAISPLDEVITIEEYDIGCETITNQHTLEGVSLEGREGRGRGWGWGKEGEWGRKEGGGGEWKERGGRRRGMGREEGGEGRGGEGRGGEGRGGGGRWGINGREERGRGRV